METLDGDFYGDLFADQNEEKSDKFDHIFIHSEMARLEVFRHKVFTRRANEVYFEISELAGRCDVLRSAITNLTLGDHYPLPLELRAAILSERKKRDLPAAVEREIPPKPEPTFTAAPRSIDPEEAERRQRDAEYVDVHFPGRAVGDAHMEQNDRFYKARHKHPKLRGQVEIDFLNGSIEQRDKIFADFRVYPPVVDSPEGS